MIFEFRSRILKKAIVAPIYIAARATNLGARSHTSFRSFSVQPSRNKPVRPHNHEMFFWPSFTLSKPSVVNMTRTLRKGPGYHRSWTRQETWNRTPIQSSLHVSKRVEGDLSHISEAVFLCAVAGYVVVESIRWYNGESQWEDAPSPAYWITLVVICLVFSVVVRLPKSIASSMWTYSTTASIVTTALRLYGNEPTRLPSGKKHQDHDREATSSASSEGWKDGTEPSANVASEDLD